jgi:hypothetical protein|tara:strand:- start:52 stop:1365 length:1314 start_codon:yes stop_codon:yes gene_type:complete
MNNELQYAGEFSLAECKLHTIKNPVIDISQEVLEINIYEDIERGGIVGNMLIVDTHSLVTVLPIVGQEKISIKIKTPGFNEENSIIDFTDDHMFVVTKLALRSELSKGAQTYQLDFSSPELLTNNRITMSKSYTDNISAMVEDILTNERYIGTTKKLFTEPTQGVRKIIIPNTQPFNFIQRLASQAISSKSQSPHYLFYEDADGFHFRTLQDLYEQPSLGMFHHGENIAKDTTNFEPKPQILVDLKRILQYELHNGNDMFINGRSGMLASTNIAHDIYSKNYVKTKYDYFDEFETNKRISNTSNPKYSEDGKLEKYFTARTFVHPISTTGGNDANYSGNIAANKRDETFFADRVSRILEMQKGISITMTISGNTAMRVGKTLSIDLPVVGVDHDETKIDKYLSGSFLVQKLRHQFIKTTKTHLVHMQITKDCVETLI